MILKCVKLHSDYTVIVQWLYSNYTVIMGSRSFKAQIVEEGILESIRIQTTQALQYWHVVHHEQALLKKEGSWYLAVSSAYLFLLMFSCLAISDSLEPRSKVPQVGAQLLLFCGTHVLLCCHYDGGLNCWLPNLEVH